MAGVTIKQLSKHYGGSSGSPALSELNLDIRDNQFVTLLGPSGCGKTTTLRLIAGYMAPDAGTIHIGDHLVSSPDAVVPPEYRGMGMVFQNYAVWPHKTVFDNVAFGLKLRRVSTVQVRERVEQTLELVGLTGLAARFPNELSGGQQQRVALARSLVVEPEILLLDEPLSNLDAKLREHMRVELKQLQRRTGITFIYVTHDQAEALALSDQIAVLDGGRLQQYDSPLNVYTRPMNRAVAQFMGHLNLLPGRVLEVDGVKASVIVATNIRLAAMLPDGIKTGDEVDVAVRPEDISLSDGESGGTFRGVIGDCTFLGNLNEYYVRLDSASVIRAQTHPTQQFAVGENVGVSFDPEHINIFRRDNHPGKS